MAQNRPDVKFIFEITDKVPLEHLQENEIGDVIFAFRCGFAVSTPFWKTKPSRALCLHENSKAKLPMTNSWADSEKDQPEISISTTSQNTRWNP